MTKVLKRNNKLEAFNPKKVRRSVAKAAKEAKLKPVKIEDLVKRVTTPVIRWARRRKVVKSTAIRKRLLEKISAKVKSVVAAWRKYDKKRHKG